MGWTLGLESNASFGASFVAVVNLWSRQKVGPPGLFRQFANPNFVLGVHSSAKATDQKASFLAFRKNKRTNLSIQIRK